MWYFKAKQYLQKSFTRSGVGTFMMGKDGANNAAVMPISTSSGFGSVTTSATGTSYVALSNQVAGSVTIVNNTGTILSVSKDGGTTQMQVPNSASFCVNFINNASNVSVKRSDDSGTQVTAYYVWEL